MSPEQLSALSKALEAGPRMGITKELQKELEACYLTRKLPSQVTMENYHRQLKHFKDAHYRNLDMWSDIMQGMPMEVLERLRARQLKKKHNPENDPETEARLLGMFEKGIKHQSESHNPGNGGKIQQEAFKEPLQKKISSYEPLNNQKPTNPVINDEGFNGDVLLCVLCFGLILLIFVLIFWGYIVGGARDL